MMPFDRSISLLTASADPVSDILRSSAYWTPLQFVYVEMAKNKDLVRISDLLKETKLMYWNIVNPEWERWKKITVIQALYVWDQIKKEL